MSGFLASIGGALTAAFEGLYDDASGIRKTVTSTDPVTVTETAYTCKAQIDDGGSFSRADGGVVVTRRTVLILRATVKDGGGNLITPEPQDELTITPAGGTAETLILGRVVERDPANSYLRLEVLQ